MAEEKCYLPCACDNSVAGNTYYRCSYGTCGGYKCQSCGAWIGSQWGATCSKEDIPRADTPQGEIQILGAEVASLKDTIKRRNRQLRDLRRSLRK